MTDGRAVAVDFARRRLGIDLTRYSETTARRVGALLADASLTADARFAAVVESCSVPETTFLRHPEQWPAIERLVLALDEARRPRPLRAWSAGTATGEEAYSLAYAIERATGRVPQILGTDINEKALGRAREGQYGRWSLRDVAADDARALLEPRGDEFRVRDRWRSGVTFSRSNLAEDPYPSDFDVILCRNVSIYLEAESMERIVRRLVASLVDGGVLVLAPFDPAWTIARRLLEPLEGSSGVFRKRAPAIDEPRASRAHPPSARPPVPLCERSGPSVHPPAESSARAPAPRATSVPHSLHSVFEAWDRGEFDVALTIARAVYFTAPHDGTSVALYGLGLARVGETRRAVPLLRDARRKLDAPPRGTEEDIDLDDLRRIVEAELRTHGAS